MKKQEEILHGHEDFFNIFNVKLMEKLKVPSWDLSNWGINTKELNDDIATVQEQNMIGNTKQEEQEI